MLKIKPKILLKTITLTKSYLIRIGEIVDIGRLPMKLYVLFEFSFISALNSVSNTFFCSETASHL